MSLCIEVLLGFCNISPSPVLTFLSQLTNSLSLCIALQTFIGNLSNASCVISSKLFILVCSCTALSSILFKPSLMQIGLDIVMIGGLLVDFVFFKATILFFEVIKSNKQWLDLALRLNTRLLPMLPLRLNGCVPICLNLEFLFLVPLFCGVITLVQPIYPQILFSMLALSMLRLIFILFGIWLLMVHFSFVFCLPKISLLTFLQSLCLPLDLLFFRPSSMYLQYHWACEGVLRI